MPSQPRAQIEQLESRQLLSISIGSGHVLNVHGNGGLANTITVGLTPGGASIYATVIFTTRKGVQTQTKSFPLAKIRRVVIDGGNKSDTITIDQTNGSFPDAALIRTHNGNDTVNAGDESDKIVLGHGTDVVNSGNGNDSITAGYGPETLVGGSGNDTFRGGHGPDDIEAGNGNNTLIDPVGHDTMMAGSGHDTFVVRNTHLNLNPVNNYDPTKDKLKKYVAPSSSGTSVGQQILNNLLDSYLF